VSADVFPIGPGIALKPEPDSAIWPSGALTQSGAVWLLRELPRATEAALDFAIAEAERRGADPEHSMECSIWRPIC
jgi:hypothetical protein